ncbi:hypothetical protein Poli38472_014374 [Pythium oligandrum]|uniref:Uncharacterized protein n=1 Tax=Pythium oligandrum TaxID=41045 RepID=A0A8K1C6Z9_PYTOL|nr:hypothetical protein Poli38472_014374 [Pythium oligandrum]|eukprot:TMW57771.1 hypothetical protein Poli38472_014374 [Pythium oligandrum]
MTSLAFATAPRARFSQASLERLRAHELFDFQLPDATLRARLQTLHALLHRDNKHAELPDDLADFVHVLEDEVHDAGGSNVFLLAALQHFRQQMDMFLELDQDQTTTLPNMFVSTKATRSTPQPSPARGHTRSLARPKAHPRPLHPIKPSGHVDDDVACGVCFQRESLEHDPIVICGACGIGVHQSCYHLTTLPDGEWFCQPCARAQQRPRSVKTTPTQEISCVACNIAGGALIATIDEDKWVHMACAMYLPELYFQPSPQNPDDDVVVGMELLQPRRQLRCLFCKKKKGGACAQCVVGKCVTAYHPLCGLRRGIRFVAMDDNDQFGSACHKHQKQFLGADHPALSAPAPSVSNTQSKNSGKRKRLVSKKRRRQGDSDDSSDDSEDDQHKMDEEDDGVVLDVESDGHVDADSDVEFQKTVVPSLKARNSPARPVKKQHFAPKKQQTLMFGQVKDLAKPPIPAFFKPKAPAVVPPQATTPTAVIPDASRLPLASRVFVPISSTKSGGDFEDVLAVLPSLPLGVGIRTDPGINGLVLGATETTNGIVLDALRRGILRDGDELLAINDVALRHRSVSALRELLATLTPPYRVWFRTSNKRPLSQVLPPPVLSRASAPATNTNEKPVQPPLQANTTQTSGKPPASTTDKPKDARSPLEEATTADWPWFYLRSDGKLAMNLLWQSLDAGFFVEKWNKPTWEQLWGNVESLVGLQLDSDSKKTELPTTESLLEMPRRDQPVPIFIIDYRKQQKNKRRGSLATDTVFVGVNMENKQSHDDTDWDALPAIAVGTTVTVAKRTWPGINKLGGAGRVRKVHTVTDKNDAGEEKQRFLYDVAYVLGGSEKMIERKYITVVNIGASESKDESDKDRAVAEEEAKPAAEPEKEEDEARLRLGMRIQVKNTDEELPPVDSTADRKVRLQVSIQNDCVFFQRMPLDVNETPSSTRELLLHRHFPVKQSPLDVLLSDALRGVVEYADERGDDDDDAMDSEEDESSEIRTQLEIAQQQLQTVMVRNKELFEVVKAAATQEHQGKQYRKRKLEAIQWKHYEDMYRDVAKAREQFDDSDDDEEEEGSGSTGAGRRHKASDRKKTEEKSEGESSGSDSDFDDSFGGMFLNKIKQEGNEVCFLCELVGGDFAATSCGRVVHPQCAMYTPETFFKDGVAHGIDQVPVDERRALTCTICGGKKGLSKIQCAHARCTVAYHVSCAYVNGCLTRDPHYQAWCPKHLKSSGMAMEIEWPRHMRPQRSTQAGKGRRHTPAKSPQRRGNPADISSSKSSSKRKRRRQASEENLDMHHKPRDVIILDQDDETTQESVEPPCVRRLVIDEDSDEGVKPVVPAVVFEKGALVNVLPREWRGSNKPGGVGRVTIVHDTKDSDGNRVVLYDVAYVLDNMKEKRVEAQYVLPYKV